MGLFKDLIRGRWEEVETHKVDYVETNKITGAQKTIFAILIVERNTKTNEFRAYTKNEYGKKTDWDFDYVRKNILEKKQ